MSLRWSEGVAELWVGTSGWVYKHWYTVFYPPKLPGDRLLPFYAERYRSVEINFSFYRLPERSAFETWRQQTPAGFLFAVKASRFLTHMKKLKDPAEPLERLMERARGLGSKLGPILFQLPPNWTLNLERLAAFVEALEPYRGQRFTFELRHQSWLDPRVYRLLEQAGAALCLPYSTTVPREDRITAPWTYIRIHGARDGGWGLADDEIAEWANRVQGYLARELDVYIYFNNDPGGHALRDADRLRARLG